MKVFKNVLIGIVICVVVLCIGLAVFVSTFNLNNYINLITKSASKALGRNVEIKNANLHLDLFKGIDLNLQNITIAEDVSFGQAEFLRLGQLTAALDTMAFIQRQEIVLTSVKISDFHVNIIKDAKGAINAQSIGPKDDKPSSSGVKSDASTIPTQQNQLTLPVVLVKSIAITNGSLIYEDKNLQMPIRIPVTQVNIQIDNFNLAGYFPINVNATVLARNNNITMNANVAINVSDQAASLKNIIVQSDLTQLDIAQLKETLPALSQIPWPSIYSGRIKVEAQPLTISAKGLSGFKALTNIENLGMKIQDLPVELKTIKMDVDVDLSQSELQGKFNFDVLNGEIKNFNLSAAILQKLEGVAVIGPLLTEVLKNKLQDLQLPDSTFINLVTLQSTIQKGQLSISNMKVLSTLITLESQGTFDLSSQLIDMPTYVTISKDLSQKLVNTVKPLKGLENSEASIYIPGKISGDMASIKYSPDISYIGKRVATSEATEALSKQLDKVIEKNPEIGSILNAVLGKDAKNAELSNDNLENLNKDEPTQESSKELIKGFLNKVLK